MAFQALRRPLHLRIAAPPSLRRRNPPTNSATAGRSFANATTARRSPYKDSQNRSDLKPGSTEGTKSGRDDDAARDRQAFDPSRTRPEAERESGGPELEVTGANQEVSKPQGDRGSQEAGPGKETRKGGKSGGESATKAGKV